LYAYGRELAPTDVADIDNFVKGLKQLNLWQNIVCWPMRSIHNIGTGSRVLSLGGLGVFDGNAINSPSWGINGIDNITNTTGYIELQLNLRNKGLLSTGCTLGSLATDHNTTNYGQSIGNETTGSWTGATGIAYFDTSTIFYFIGTPTSAGAYGGSKNNLYTITSSGSINTLFSNGSQVSTDTRARVNFTNTRITLLAGRSGSTESGSILYHLNARMALGFIGNKVFNSLEISAFYNLYKQTIGKGLGLP
jgi:hypothetical protein